MRGLSPLGYMLKVLRDPNASKQRRDRMAICAARYIHRRPGDDGVGKKQELAEAAREAGGEEWAGDLDPNSHRPQ
jgi:phage terminase small subunit